GEKPAFNILRALDLASRIKDTNRQKAAFETIILAYIKKPTAELGSRQTIEKAIGETLQHLSPDILGSLAASLTDDFRRLHPAIAEALWSKNKLLENPQVEF
ncbi:MAG TPA: hypothetical protein VMR37_03485, partial [Rhabdochlamydiaceae bacterium]|nr:hypothetical protein [Rhabdochlamydiaceae bacterium]